MASPDPSRTATRDQPTGASLRHGVPDADPEPAADGVEHRAGIGSHPQWDADRQLVDRVIGGDREAAMEFFRDYLATRLTTLIKQLKVEDLTGSLFVYLAENDWKRLRTWKGESSLATWVTRVAARFFIRNRLDPIGVSQDKEVVDRGLDNDPAEDLIRSETRVALFRAIQSLPSDKERLAIRLIFLREMSLSQVAREMKISVANLSVIKHRAVQHLRAYFEGRDRDV
jgi:RNA polymerase sigma factor (sigma-70 family)